MASKRKTLNSGGACWWRCGGGVTVAVAVRRGARRVRSDGEEGTACGVVSLGTCTVCAVVCVRCYLLV